MLAICLLGFATQQAHSNGESCWNQQRQQWIQCPDHCDTCNRQTGNCQHRNDLPGCANVPHGHSHSHSDAAPQHNHHAWESCWNAARQQWIECPDRCDYCNRETKQCVHTVVKPGCAGTTHGQSHGHGQCRSAADCMDQCDYCNTNTGQCVHDNQKPGCGGHQHK